MSEPEPAQGRPAQGAAATETDAPATETDARLFLDFSQHSFVRAQSNESCELCDASGLDACRCAGSSGCSLIAALIAERSLDESAPLFNDSSSFFNPELWVLSQ